jgi:hypothetical protein
MAQYIEDESYVLRSKLIAMNKLLVPNLVESWNT